MTSTQEAHFNKMQEDVTEVKALVGNLQHSINVLTYALVGNDMTKDGGLIKRVNDSEKKIAEQQQEINDLRKELSKADVYTKIIWGICTALGGGVLAWVLKSVLG